MRDYKRKMDKYRLPQRRCEELREFCLCAGHDEREIIETAVRMTADDGLCVWLYKHVVSTDYRWAKMEADGLPCGRDTFRVLRARFYWNLDGLLNGATRKK